MLCQGRVDVVGLRAFARLVSLKQAGAVNPEPISRNPNFESLKPGSRIHQGRCPAFVSYRARPLTALVP